MSKLYRGKPTKHSLETNFQFRDKSRGIKPFGGANKSEILRELAQLNRDSNNRKAYTEKLLQDENALVFHFSIISENSDDLGPKAARAIELVCKENPKTIYAHLDKILQLAENATKDAVIRPLAKILELMAIAHFSEKKSFQLNANEIEKIIAICFDWMITEQKVAPQAYSMQTLYLLGKEVDWVHKELAIILQQNYASGSAGYKNRSKKIITLIEQ